jgi:WD40 repeat protein
MRLRFRFILLIVDLFLLLSSQTISLYAQNTSRAVVLVWSSDESTILIGRDNGLVEGYVATTGQLIYSLNAHTDTVMSIAVNSISTEFATASVDATIRTWALDTGEPLQTFVGHEGWVISVIWSPDDLQLISSGFGEEHNFRVWNAATGNLQEELAIDATFVDFMWSPNYQVLAGSAAAVQFVSAQDYEPINYVGFQETGITASDWSPDGRFVAAGGRDGGLNTYSFDPFTRNAITTLSVTSATEIGHDTTAIRDVRYTADGEYLLSVAADGAIRVWETDTWDLTASTDRLAFSTGTTLQTTSFTDLNLTSP